MDSRFNKPIMDYTENLQKCHGYLKALEEERTKIELFQRELPLSLGLVTRAIEAFKQQKSSINTECSEETTSDGPVFEEFMPIKKRCSSREEKGDDDSELESRNNFNDDDSGEGKKLDWLRSVQLWNQAIDPPTEEEHQIKQSAIEVKRNGGAFHPFKKETKTTTSVGPTAATVEEAGGGDKEGGEGEPKKARRCWSPELHRRFLNALQQLGGSHAATPKQIKELMNVDGLTNDEVKSHLQKFRLHSRRPAAAAAPHGNTSTQAPQFFVVGGIWVPPPRQTGGMPGGIVVPVAAQAPAVLPHHHQAQKEQEKLTSTSSESARCNSSVTSASTHTTTTSPASLPLLL